MNDAQTWTAIGGLLAVLFAFTGPIIRPLGDTLDATFATIEAKMDAGFGSLERRVDGLDRHVAAITRRLLDGQ